MIPTPTIRRSLLSRHRVSRGLHALTIALCWIFAAGASSAFEVVVESVDVTSDETVAVTSFFDVYVRLDIDDTNPPDIGSYQVAVDLVNPSAGVLSAGVHNPAEDAEISSGNAVPA